MAFLIQSHIQGTRISVKLLCQLPRKVARPKGHDSFLSPMGFVCPGFIAKRVNQKPPTKLTSYRFTWRFQEKFILKLDICRSKTSERIRERLLRSASACFESADSCDVLIRLEPTSA